MEERSLTQADVAREASVSQPTVSRALRGVPLRTGRARDRLLIYSGMGAAEANGPDRIAAAFQRIWDKTEAHADAVVKVIDALEGLAPVKRD